MSGASTKKTILFGIHNAAYDKTFRFWPVVGLSALAVGILLISQLFVAFFLFMIGASWGIDGADLEAFFFETSPGQLAFIFAAEVFVVASVWFLLRMRLGKDSKPFKALGLGRLKKSDIKWTLVGIGAFYLVVFVGSMIIYSFFTGIDTEQQQQIGFGDASDSTVNLLSGFVALVILPPIAEEILMRGYLFSGLRKYLSFIWSAIIVSVIFAAAHLEIGSGAPPLWSAGIVTFFLSLVLVWLKEKTGSLWPCIGVHAFNNFIAYIYIIAPS